MGAQTLSDQEKGQVTFVHGSSCDVLSTTVARLYEGKQGRWEFTGVVGACSVVSNRVEKTHYIRILDIRGSPRTIFEQEIYDTFVFEKQKDFFYTFEGDTAVYGLSFVDTVEAAEFYGQICNIKSGGKAVTLNPNSSSGKLPASTSSSTSQPKADKKKSKGGFMSKFFGREEEELEISAPTDFKHQSHIGWDPEKGFEIRDIPADWRKLFQSAGIKKSELKNAETAQFIVNVIGEQLASGAMGDAPLTPSRSAPPPPPSGPRASVAPPPPPSGPRASVAPPPPPSHVPRTSAPPPPPPPPTAGAPPPPPPPPPMAKAGGPPPPPPPSTSSTRPPTGGHSSGGGDSRNDLLASIRQGTQLKQVDHSNPLPNIQDLGDVGNRSLVDTLAAAMANRRNNMGEDESDDDDDDDDDWSS